MNVRIEGNCKKPTKQWPNNLYYECEFIAEHYLNTLVKFWNFSHRISRLRAIDCSSCDCGSRHDDCSRGWDFISSVWPFSNFFLNIGRERRWPRWIKKASHIGSKRLCFFGMDLLFVCRKKRQRNCVGKDMLESKLNKYFINYILALIIPCLKGCSFKLSSRLRLAVAKPETTKNRSETSIPNQKYALHQADQLYIQLLGFK